MPTCARISKCDHIGPVHNLITDGKADMSAEAHEPIRIVEDAENALDVRCNDNIYGSKIDEVKFIVMRREDGLEWVENVNFLDLVTHKVRAVSSATPPDNPQLLSDSDSGFSEAGEGATTDVSKTTSMAGKTPSEKTETSAPGKGYYGEHNCVKWSTKEKLVLMRIYDTFDRHHPTGRPRDGSMQKELVEKHNEWLEENGCEHTRTFNGMREQQKKLLKNGWTSMNLAERIARGVKNEKNEVGSESGGIGKKRTAKDRPATAPPPPKSCKITTQAAAEEEGKVGEGGAGARKEETRAKVVGIEFGGANLETTG